MQYIDPIDQKYIDELDANIRSSSNLYLPNLRAITFWLTLDGDSFIGTSFIYNNSGTKNKYIYWVPSNTEIPEIIANNEALAQTIPKLKGQYISYLYHNEHWCFIGEGDYDHTSILMRINNRVIPERYRSIIETEHADKLK